MPYVTNASVLKMAKYEIKRFNRFSSDVFIDSEATKTFYNSKIINKTNSTLKGYVQDIRQNSFGILFFSEKQVNKIIKYAV